MRTLLALLKLPVVLLQLACLLLILPTLPLFFVLGLLLRVLVFLTPTFTLKLALARLVLVWPLRLLDRDMAEEAGEEVRWIVCSRYSDEINGAAERAQYAKILEKAWA